MRRVGRRLLGLDEPQETRFFLFIAAWAVGAGLVYWFVSYEVAGTALLLGVGAACGLVVMRLVFVRRAGDVRRRARAEAEAAAAEGMAANKQGEQGERDDQRSTPREGQGGGTAGIDRPFGDETGLLPDPTLAPFAIGLGVALCTLGVIFGPAPVLVGLLPLAWGASLWLSAARSEFRTTEMAGPTDDVTSAAPPSTDRHGPAGPPAGGGSATGTGSAPASASGPPRTERPDEGRHQVVILGGGFGGLHCARALDDRGIEATLIDARNFHLFQPLLYQVATGALSPGDIASSLRAVFERRQHVTVLLGEVEAIDPQARLVRFVDGGDMTYDTLVLATGSETSYHGHDEWAEHAPGLKTVEEAEEIRRRILSAFERAERTSDPDVRRRELTFVVVGGGPTGVELAGAIGEIANVAFRRRFRRIDPHSARIVLIHAEPRVLGEFPERLAVKAGRDLAKVGVEVLTSTRVVDVQPWGVAVEDRDGAGRIESTTVLWAAGVRGSSIGAQLAAATGSPLARGGRIAVGPDLTLPGHPEIFVIGDLAATSDAETGRPLPGVAPVAMQAGTFVAAAIRDRLDGRPVRAFRYRDKGALATIGTGKAIARLGRLDFDGRLAWLLWLFVHIMSLIEYQNRILVFVQWAWSFATRGRSALLITGPRHPIDVQGPRP
jgi:NADH dehydrogenase